MCGICGQFNLNGTAVQSDSVQKMTDAIRHRGPDGEGVYAKGPVGLGHRRLSIIDLSDAGSQPMFNQDRSKTLVFNGEIYNYQALRQRLESQGEKFQSTSDTEVLLRLYDLKGPACLQDLEGMFAFAIWDERAQELFIARDRVGIKPLYYYVDQRTLLFASEIKAILVSPAVPRNINPDALITYVTFVHSMAPDTIYRGIRKLLPGHYMIAKPTGIAIQKYWDVDTVEQRPFVDEQECSEEVKRRLRDAVISHMVSDVPVGAFLSGGIDSSAAVAFMAEASSAPVKTFAMGFDIGGYYNELADARRIATLFHTDHHEHIVEQMDVQKLIEKLVYHYDEPFADAANLPTYMMSEFARRHVKVVLSGEGGDEVFGGYRRYITHNLARYYQWVPAFVRDHVISPLAQQVPVVRKQGSIEFARRLRKAVDTMSVPEPDVRYGTWLAMFTDEGRRELFNGEVGPRLKDFDVFRPYREHYNKGRGWDTTNHALYTDLKTWLPDTYLEKVDKATMAVSLEARVPFLDHRLVEYAFGLPGRMKVRGGTTKYILKKALEGLLPNETLYKPKHGFGVPLDEWFRGTLKRFAADVLFDERARKHHYFNPQYVERVYSDHINGKNNFGLHLWMLVNFELWHRQYMEQ